MPADWLPGALLLGLLTGSTEQWEKPETKGSRRRTLQREPFRRGHRPWRGRRLRAAQREKSHVEILIVTNL